MKPRISVTKRFEFEASHSLPHYKGKCARNHGHSYKFKVTIKGDPHTKGPLKGMIIDFAEVTRVVNKEVVDLWDHQNLNELVNGPTTVENLAVIIFNRLRTAGLMVSKIELWETDKCSATVEI